MRVVFASFGGIIVGAFAVIVVVTVTRTYVKNRRGKPFVVEAFTEVVCGDDVLGGVEANVLFSGDTWDSGSATTASRPRLPDSWTSAQRGCETEFEFRRSLPGERVGQGQARRWCGSGESELLEGASPNGSEMRGVTTEHDV